MENNKNHQITLLKGKIGFSMLDVIDHEVPKYQIRDTMELANVILTENSDFNDCFLLHSPIPAQAFQDCLKIVNGTSQTVLNQPGTFTIFVPADLKPTDEFTKGILNGTPNLRETCANYRLQNGDFLPFWDPLTERFIYVLVIKDKANSQVKPQSLTRALNAMKGHATNHSVKTISMLKNGQDLEQLNWNETLNTIQDVFAYSNTQVQIFTQRPVDVFAMTTRGDPESLAEDEIER